MSNWKENKVVGIVAAVVVVLVAIVMIKMVSSHGKLTKEEMQKIEEMSAKADRQLKAHRD
ncbi:MAG: hypothetical protein L6416_03505 [Candidatus Omnitrophica bacterium]|nr:hypothetical protein [Candidatus Omnitrophota bacterium]